MHTMLDSRGGPRIGYFSVRLLYEPEGHAVMFSLGLFSENDRGYPKATT